MTLDNAIKPQSLLKLILTGVMVATVGFLAYKAYTSWESLREYDWEIQAIWLVPWLVAFLSQSLLAVWNWRSIVDHLAGSLPFRRHLKIYCLTNLTRRIPASLLWLVVSRAYWYRGLSIPTSASATASVLELELSILAGLPIGVLHLGVVASLKPEYTLLLSAGVVALVGLLIRPDALNLIRRLFRRETTVTNLTYRDSLGWILFYTAIWLLSGAGLYCAINLFHDLPLRTIPGIIGAWTLASLVSYFTLLTPGGFGVKELSLTFLLTSYLPEPLPLVVALATRALLTLYDILVGLASLTL